jgi:hypothetical protein
VTAVARSIENLVAASSFRDGGTTILIDPASEGSIGELGLASAAEADAAIEAAARAFPAWRAVSPGDRARLLRRFADLVGAGLAGTERLVLDHGAKPDIAGGGWQPWADAIADMARVPSLRCKVSGLVTEADHATWTAEQIARYLDHLLACFGPDRLMFGSDWPVCRLAADYGRVHDLIADFVARECPDAHDRIFGGNATIAYAL